MVCHYQHAVNVTDMLQPTKDSIRQAFEDVDEWRKKMTHELYKDVTQSELAKATRWIKHANPFATHRSCSPWMHLFQDMRIASFLKELKDITWSPDEMRDLIAHYVYHTTGLDGNNLTLPETFLVVEHKKCEHCDTDARQSIIEAKNIDQILSTYPLFSMETKPDTLDLTMQQLIDMNSAILNDLGLPGGLRQTQDGIAQRKVLLPKPDELVHLVERYLAWLKEKVNELKPDDVKGAISLACDAHTRFMHIHPFADGNGRLARLISALVVRKVGLPAPMIRRDYRTQYNDAVADACMHGKYQAICQLFYDGLVYTLDHMNTLVKKRSEKSS
jgi:Fic family protein